MEKTEFQQWYDNLPVSKVEEIRVEIMKKCFVSKHVVTNWRKGRTEVPQLAKSVINNISENFGLDKVFCV